MTTGMETMETIVLMIFWQKNTNLFWPYVICLHQICQIFSDIDAFLAYNQILIRFHPMDTEGNFPYR